MDTQGMQLDGKIAVITGAASGIGLALTERFLSEGMSVVMADVEAEVLHEQAGRLQAAGAAVTAVVCDVSDAEQVAALRDTAVATYGAVHVLCNNAGVASGAKGRIWEHETNDWGFAFSVHVYGVINGINAFVPTMLAQGDECHIVNTTSSNGGFAPIASSATYATCKAACVTISECLWGQLHAIDAKIGVSVLFPTGRTKGILNTGIWAASERPPEFPADHEIDTTSAMAGWMKAMEDAGTPVEFTPLSEVADTVVEGLYADRFWMVEEGRFEDTVKARTQIILDRAHPLYG